MKEKVIIYKIYIFIALLYIILLSIHPYPFSSVIRLLPVLMFAYLCFKYLKEPMKFFMGIGYICCTCGDIFLDLSRTEFFIQALAAFLFGQIFYIIAFAQQFYYRKKRLYLALSPLLYALVITIILFPRLGTFLIPVLVYIVVITLMGIFSAFINSKKTGIFIGAMIFIISDSLIAINKFVVPFKYSTAIIISLYFIAQYMIGTGVLKDFSVNTEKDLDKY